MDFFEWVGLALWWRGIKKALIDKIVHHNVLLLIQPVFKLVYLGSEVEIKVTLFCIIFLLVLLTHILLRSCYSDPGVDLSLTEWVKTSLRVPVLWCKEKFLETCLLYVSRGLDVFFRVLGAIVKRYIYALWHTRYD